MSFENFSINSDKLNYWENDVMNEFQNTFGGFDGNEIRIRELIAFCEAEIATPKSWLTEFAARTALVNLKGALEEC